MVKLEELRSRAVIIEFFSIAIIAVKLAYELLWPVGMWGLWGGGIKGQQLHYTFYGII